MYKKYLIVSIILIIVIGFGYYAISPLFRNVYSDEKLPQASSNINKISLGNVSPITGTTGHPASGTVRLITVDNTTYIRYENFKTINGPDIYVYLAKDLEAKEYINLGKVKATEGNINYAIPDGIIASEYPYVLTWCKTFGVLFNSAKL